MGIYQGTNRIDSVNVGNKDMVCVMQDNHILALGKKYWAVDLGSLTWSYSSGIFMATLPSVMLSGGSSLKPKIYCPIYATETPSNVYNKVKDKAITISQLVTSVWVNDTDYNDVDVFKSAMSGVWLIYEFNQTLYAKVDLGSLSWNYNTSLKYYHTASLREVIKLPANNNTIANIYSFIFKSETLNNIYNNSATYDNSIAVQTTPVGSDGYVAISKQSITSAEDFTRFVKGKEILYEVAE